MLVAEEILLKVSSINECAHKFQEESLGKILELSRKTVTAICELEGVLKKHKEMFPSAKQSYTTKKRRRKENKAKSKKRKLDRKTKNCSKLLQQILHVESPDNQIVSDHINDNVIRKLNKKSAKWLKVLVSEAKFTSEALSKIKEALPKDLLPTVFFKSESADGDDEKESKKERSSDDDAKGQSSADDGDDDEKEQNSDDDDAK